MDKILFICEGAKTEKKFCNLIIDKYFIQNNREKEYVAFGTIFMDCMTKCLKMKG